MKVCQVKNIRIGEGKPKICVPLVSYTLLEIIEEIKVIKKYPVDIIEWRMDMYQDIKDITKTTSALQQIRELLADIPLLCTFRTVYEGGKTTLSISEYMKLNSLIITSGNTDIIDIELSQAQDTIAFYISLAKENNVKVLLSNHDFEKTPTKKEIIHRLLSMQNLGCDIAKIAVMPSNKKDVLTLLDATATMEEHATIPIVTMSMHDIGRISRFTGELFGSSMTFASVKNASAPGQIDITELDQLLSLVHKDS
jgi:3-dehydroquinate dehydratase-1